jgi:hypothetical protein
MQHEMHDLPQTTRATAIATKGLKKNLEAVRGKLMTQINIISNQSAA